MTKTNKQETTYNISSNIIIIREKILSSERITKYRLHKYYNSSKVNEVI